MKRIRMLLSALFIGAVAASPLYAAEQTPLFSCSFEDVSDMNLWTVIDGGSSNNDYQKWHWSKWAPDGEDLVGCAEIQNDENTDEWDYMVLKTPVSLSAGNYSFDITWSSYGNYQQTFKILYGKSKEIASMTAAGERNKVTNKKWFEDHMNFTVEEEGEYYFAVAAANDILSYYLVIRDLKILEGFASGTPDLGIVCIGQPLSSCNLGEETLSLTLKNAGNVDVNKVKVSYRLNGGDPVEQTFEKKVGIKDSASFEFAKIDMSEVKEYNIEVEVAVADGNVEENLSDNTKSMTVQHWAPVELPFTTDFSTVNDGYKNWTWDVNGDRFGACVYSEERRVLGILANDMPLYSRCMNLQASKTYALDFSYIAGWQAGELKWFETFTVAFGKMGTDFKTWETIVFKQDDYTDNMVKLEHLTFSPEEDGIYTIAVYCNEAATTLGVQHIEIRENPDNDLEFVEFGPIATRIPAKQINGKTAIPVTLVNRGNINVDNAKVSIKLNGTEIGSKTFAVGKPGEQKRVWIPVSASGLKEGDKVEYVATASIEGAEDARPENNTLRAKATVTESELGYDLADKTMCDSVRYAVGGNDYNVVVIGVPMYFNHRDTLTGLNVLCAKSYDADVRFAISCYDGVSDTLGRTIFATTMAKKPTAGTQFFDLPDILLDSGYYMISMALTDNALICDTMPDGVIYQLADGKINVVYGYGSAAIRAVFGADAKPQAKNPLVANIEKPVDGKLYSANETITVVVSNAGFETAEAEVSVRVNNVELPEKKKVNIPGYTSLWLDFTADLSAPNTKYVITAILTSEEDEDPTNNSFSISVRSAKLQDPYVMDFEYCEEFAIDNFNPSWKTVDADGKPTLPLLASNPHNGKPFAFIAMEADIIGIEAPQGKMIGATFGTKEGQVEDWLISPALTLPEKDAEIRFMARSLTAEWGFEEYRVLVSSTENLKDFTLLRTGFADTAWEEIVVDLSVFAGKTVYLAIECTSPDAVVLMVDNIRVSRPETSNESLREVAVKVYPNPAKEMISLRCEGADIEQVDIFDLSGRTVYRAAGAYGESFRYNVSAMPEGMYFARVKTSRGTGTVKFTVR